MAKVFSSTGVTTGTYSDRLAVASPYLGQQFYQTDTDELLKYATDLDTQNRWMQADHDYNRNLVVNGGFDIWQRATSATIAALDYYGPADRWQTVRLSSDTQRTFSRQPVTSSDTPVLGFTYFMRCQRDAATVATNSILMATSFETTSVRRTQNKYVTLSFYARAGANYSAASGYLRAYITTGTGTDGRLITGNFTSSATLVDSNNVLTTSWKRFTITTSAAVANTVTQMGINFQFVPVGTAGAADYYDITGVQLETGTAPSEFEYREFGDELRRCQRYLYAVTGSASTLYPEINGFGLSTSTTNTEFNVFLPVAMRATPSGNIVWTTLRIYDGSVGSVVSSIVFNANFNNNQTATFTITHGATVTAFRPVRLQGNNSATSTFQVSAEL
jgi:hypothetical protein